MKFSQQIVVVTGAGSGIGKEVALTYAREGARVVAADFHFENGSKTVKEIKEAGGEALFIETDVRKPDDISELFIKTVTAYGTVDILINNAGISKWKPPLELSAAEWDDVINTNLRSVFLCTKEAARYMKANPKGGAVVNMASTRAYMSEPNSEAYAASKGGIIALTHAMAVSLGKEGVRVNSISPGWIETKNYDKLREKDHLQHPVKRVGKPSDIAKGCLYLTDPENDFLTGQNIMIDGGMTIKMIYEE
ncbi:SDR family NAD(P)-dependent oxidoreductase [Heyndrickxia acidicola]|uniref:SDR family oxidoreductase n=1 Tax=Heyndrickxia acidicola TaxID=209389 RepID=A0ABU6MHB2_9BACI|nr:glucose 1-dehydrogenase [Heyndrickxia acidicola]MED1204070.1 SDR family oxidoreductase [Heyndrickxia acidicola]